MDLANVDVETAPQAYSYKNSTLLILAVFELFTLEICHLSLKDSLPFNTFNCFIATIESFQTL